MNLFPLDNLTRNGQNASGRCGTSVLHAQAPNALSAAPIVLAVRPEHMACPPVRGLTRVPAAGACARHPYGVRQAALTDLVGEHLLRHRRAADVA